MAKKTIFTVLILPFLLFGFSPTPPIISIDFDGIDDFVNAGSASDIDDIFATGGTIAAWINHDTYGESGVGRILNKRTNSGGGLGWFLATRGEGSDFLFQHDYTTTDGQWTFPDNGTDVWQHIVVTFDDADSAPVCYLDGVSQTVTTLVASSGTPTSDAAENLIIGAAGTVGFLDMDGMVTAVTLWDIELTADEVAKIANSRKILMPLQIQSANLLRLWVFDEVIDGGDFDGIVVWDYSSSGVTITPDDGANNTGLLSTATNELTY